MQPLDLGWPESWQNIGPEQTVQAFEYAQRWPGILAGRHTRTKPNTTAAESFNNRAYDGVLHAGYIARQYGPWGPNMATGETPAIQGSQAQAYWLAGIASIKNRLPGKP